MRKASTREAVFDGPSWDARTAVHEYGGGHAVAHNGTVYFSNLNDNRVYQVFPGGTPTPVTPGRPFAPRCVRTVQRYLQKNLQCTLSGALRISLFIRCTLAFSLRSGKTTPWKTV